MGCVRGVLIKTQGDKLDVYIKKVGLPFPESPKVGTDARKVAENQWFDRWSELFGMKPTDWHPRAEVPPSQRLAGSFDQDFVDRMQIQITRRRSGKQDGVENPVSVCVPWQADTRDRTVVSCVCVFWLGVLRPRVAALRHPAPLRWQYEYAAKSEEEKAAFEARLEEEARTNPPKDITFLDTDGKTVLTLEQVEERRRANPDWKPNAPPPKTWLLELKRRNREHLLHKIAKEMAEARAAAPAEAAGEEVARA
jgi:hypothetical protein